MPQIYTLVSMEFEVQPIDRLAGIQGHQIIKPLDPWISFRDSIDQICLLFDKS